MSTLAQVQASTRFDFQPDLEACESVIKEAFSAYARAGLALRTIRDHKLYKQEFSRFDDYCRSTWGWSRVHAHRLIEAAEIHEALYERLLPIGNKKLPLPRAESTARALKPISDDPELLATTWVEVVDRVGDEPTAAQVSKIVAGVIGLPSEAPPSQPTAGTALKRLLARGYSISELRQALENIAREEANER